jgi:hypothetical protein
MLPRKPAYNPASNYNPIPAGAGGGLFSGQITELIIQNDVYPEVVQRGV